MAQFNLNFTRQKLASLTYLFSVHNFKSNDEFYKHLDVLAASLNNLGFSEAGQRISFLLHKVAWTTSSELFGELKILFLELLKKHKDSFPQHIKDNLKTCIQVIDTAWNKK